MPRSYFAWPLSSMSPASIPAQRKYFANSLASPFTRNVASALGSGIRLKSRDPWPERATDRQTTEDTFATDRANSNRPVKVLGGSAQCGACKLSAEQANVPR